MMPYGYYVVLGTSISAIIYATAFWDRGWAYRKTLFNPNQMRSLKDLFSRIITLLTGFIGNIIGTKAKAQLNDVGIDESLFIKQILIAPSVGFVVGIILAILLKVPFIKAIWVGAILAGIALILTKISLEREIRIFRREAVQATPDWVNILKINLIAGDTVENAVWNSISYVPVAIQNRLVNIKNRCEGEMDFTNSLKLEISKTEETELLSVYNQILAYHVAGINDEDRPNVFGNMSQHMAKIYSDKSRAAIEGVKGPIVILILLAFLRLLVSIGVPLLVLMMKRILNQ